MLEKGNSNLNSLVSLKKKVSMSPKWTSYLNLQYLPIDFDKKMISNYKRDKIKNNLKKNSDKYKIKKFMNNKIFWDKDMSIKYNELKTNYTNDNDDKKVKNKNKKLKEIDDYINKFINNDTENELIRLKKKTNKNNNDENNNKNKFKFNFSLKKTKTIFSKNNIEKKYLKILNKKENKSIKNYFFKSNNYKEKCSNIIKQCSNLTNKTNKFKTIQRSPENKINKSKFHKFFNKKNNKFLKFVIKNYNK